jgi:hypothetical protein
MQARGRTALVVAVAALAGSAATASPAAAGGNGGFGCPPGFDIGAVTAAQGLALPRIQAGIAAGAYTAAEAQAIFAGIDRNGDGVICVKDVATLTNDHALGAGSQYAYNGVDDNAAAGG